MINNNVRISIIIPVYNNETYLKACLDSVLSQGMEELEVICINDASTDRCAEILEEYAQKHSHVRVISYEQNKSASQARKDGVLLSKGKYILFVDGDDLLEPGACRELYMEMEKDPVDILHFGTTILNWSGVETSRIQAMERLLEPYAGRLEGKEVFEGCFREKKYGFSLWNKLYSGNLCRKAMRCVEDGVFPKAQDKYAFFVIAYFAESYRGCEKNCYIYRFGSGITGHICLEFKQYERYCTMGKTADAIGRFIEKEDANIPYAELVQDSRRQLLDDVVANWGRVRNVARAAAFDCILRYWNAAETIAAFAKKYWFDQGTVAKGIKGAQSLIPRHGNRKIKTIGSHYMRICGGGAQRVTAMLANLWQEMGYRVVLFTDCAKSEDDYDLNDGIERVTIPARESMGREDYGKRAEVLEQEIKRYGVDVMVYHPWVSDILLWDLLVCKLAGADFIVQCHSVFPVLMRNFRIYFARMIKIYELCDAVVTLSRTDQLFWQNFNPNVYETRNPLFFDRNAICPSELQGSDIVWIGRFNTEKRPMDALKIMQKVLIEEPKARLFMLGEIHAEARKFYEKKLIEMELDKHVVICGYVSDISEYLQKASLQLMTSEYEGFPLALLEGMAYGLPCVMYELPYLFLAKNHEGITAVEYKDTASAAIEVLNLLRNKKKRTEMGKAAYAFIKQMATFQFDKKWKEIFDSLNQNHSMVDQEKLLMFHTLFDFYEEGALRANRNRGNEEQQNIILSLLTKKAVFWGSGQRAHRFLDKYPELTIAFCIDNDASKEGTCMDLVPVIHTDHVQDWDKLFIIITVASNKDIVEQLKDKGMRYGTDYIFATDIFALD